MADVTWAGTLRRRKKKLADLSGGIPKDEGIGSRILQPCLIFCKRKSIKRWNEREPGGASCGMQDVQASPSFPLSTLQSFFSHRENKENFPYLNSFIFYRKRSSIFSFRF